MKKIVTVIISAYRAHNFIHDLIDSIIMQSLPSRFSLEVLICVDGCQYTWNELNKYNRKDFKRILLKKNYGTYIAFNTAMDLASGEIIFRFDADDIMLKNYLYDQVEVLRSSQDVHLTRTWSIYTDIYKQPIVHELRDGTFTSHEGKRNKGSDGQFAMRKCVWDQLGGFQPWRCFADTDFLIRSKFAGFKLIEVDRHLYLRRVHPGSLTQNINTGYDSEMRKMHKEDLKKRSNLYALGEKCYLKPQKGIVLEVQ